MQIASDAHHNLAEYVDELVKELEHTNKKQRSKDATVKNLTNRVAQLEQEVNSLKLQTENQYDESFELQLRLDEAEIRCKKNEKANEKLAKLRSQWTGIAELFGPEIKGGVRR